MSVTLNLARLRRGASLRALLIDLAAVLPLAAGFAALTAVLAGAIAAAVLLAASLIGLIASAIRHVRHHDQAWLLRALDAACPTLEDSSALAMQATTPASPLAALQQARIRERLVRLLAESRIPDLRAPWPRRRLLRLLLAGLAALLKYPQRFKDRKGRILTDEDIWSHMTTTAHFLIWTIVLQVIIGFTLAWLINRKFKGNDLLTTLIVVPMMLSPAVVGNFWTFLYQPQIGLINYAVELVSGIPASSFSMLGPGGLAPWSIIIVDTWMWTPFVMLICLAGLRSIPEIGRAHV